MISLGELRRKPIYSFQQKISISKNSIILKIYDCVFNMSADMVHEASSGNMCRGLCIFFIIKMHDVTIIFYSYGLRPAINCIT